MGANTFCQSAKGQSAQEAFRKAVDEARYENGHRGYTGTLAEKGSFVEIRECAPLTMQEAQKQADLLIDAGDERIDDKWGPAGCIVVRKPDVLQPCGKDKALSLARAKFGPTAELVLKTERASKANGGKKTVRAAIFIVSEKQGFGCNEKVPGGWRRSVASAEGPDEKTACGNLFCEPGEYLFFGWASS